MKGGDKYVYMAVGALFLASLALSFNLLYGGASPAGVPTVEISRSGELLRRAALDSESKNVVIDDEYGYNEIGIADGVIAMIAADCLGGDCLKMAPIDVRRRPGQVIVCLPHRLVVKLAGGGGASEGEDILDALSH